MAFLMSQKQVLEISSEASTSPIGPSSRKFIHSDRFDRASGSVSGQRPARIGRSLPKLTELREDSRSISCTILYEIDISTAWHFCSNFSQKLFIIHTRITVG